MVGSNMLGSSSMRTCSAPGCARKHDSNGLCSSHAQHWRKTGRIETLPSERTLDERFDARVERGDGCWIWVGGVRGDGYGGFHLTSSAPGRPEWLPQMKSVGAHQYALARVLGRWPSGQTLHHCDTPRCVRPDHLYEGTHQDNMRDYSARSPATKGHAFPKSRLTVEDVRALRDGTVTDAEIAELRGVQAQTAEHARKRITWKWLDSE